ncbi:MAG: PVC-type heme-binding CxxCH protein, partial [Pirellulales bacterium]
MLSFRAPVFFTCGLLLLVTTRSLAQQVPADFKVDLIYQVPDIEHPSAVTCDDQGNLFVGEDPMDMRGPSTDPIDRIVLIRWDAAGGPPIKTVFCENLSAVFGMVWHQDALYVMNAPYYTMLKDTDGDGIADMRQCLADSFGHAPGLFGLNNHVPSGMRLGLDGFVYVALGDKGLPKAVGTDGSTITLEGGGVFRMRPDASQLEVVSSGIRNNMDVALDRFDNIFSFDNDDDFGWWTRIIHHVPTGYYGYPYDYRSQRNPYLPPVGEFGGGTACGGACYREAAWPAKYQGSAFFCDWGDSKIEHYKLTKKGASFEVQVEDFMLGDESGDFRPIDLCFSPDGNHMYVADWNIAGGRKPDNVGRLFRVSYVGDEVSPKPNPAQNTDPIEAQIRALGHPSHHQRMRVQQRLAAFGMAAVGPVSELLDSKASVLMKVHAIWTQNALIDELEDYDPTPDWIAALQNPDADIRGQAARALGNRRFKAASTKLATALKDPDAAVRMQAAIALGRIGDADSASPLYKALGEQDLVARRGQLCHCNEGLLDVRHLDLQAAPVAFKRRKRHVLLPLVRNATPVAGFVLLARLRHRTRADRPW